MTDFVCQCGEVQERFIDTNVKTVPCTKCDLDAYRSIPAPSYFKMDGFRSDIMSDSWAIKREKNAKRKFDNHGGM